MSSIYSDAANPYEPPSGEARNKNLDAARSPIDFGEVVRRWERMRLFFNGFLVLLVLAATLTLSPPALFDGGYWVRLLVGAAIANLCFMTGPAIDAYLLWFRLWNLALIGILFLCGMLLTALLALGCVVSYLVPFDK